VSRSVVLALLILAIAAADALATFPGRNGRIAFVSAQYPDECGEDCSPDFEQIWIVKPGARKRLVSNATRLSCTAFSPNGRQLAVSLDFKISIIRTKGPAKRLGRG
jgi:hypothetical protein